MPHTTLRIYSSWVFYNFGYRKVGIMSVAQADSDTTESSESTMNLQKSFTPLSPTSRHTSESQAKTVSSLVVAVTLNTIFHRALPQNRTITQSWSITNHKVWIPNIHTSNVQQKMNRTNNQVNRGNRDLQHFAPKQCTEYRLRHLHVLHESCMSDQCIWHQLKFHAP